jgi:dTMP kinase
VFVTFEGIDRSGKTTQARMLVEALGDEALLVREPGGTPESERIRELVKDPAAHFSAVTETLLFGAARAELVERVVRPALAEGRVVVSDRYIDSTVAYQGGARGLGVGPVTEVNRFATGGVLPDLVVLLDLDPAAGLARAAGERDRIEGQELEFHRAVARAYRALAAEQPDRFLVVDASAEADQVAEQVRAGVLARMEGSRVGLG